MLRGTSASSAGRTIGRLFLGGFLSFVLLLGGCEEQQARIRLQVTVDPDIRIPEQIDALTVIATASRTEGRSFCLPVTRTFRLAGPGDLPILVEFHPGDMFDSWAYFRVEWYRGGDFINAGDVRAAFPPPAGGRRDATIRIELPCVTSRCGPDQMCDEGGTCRPPIEGGLDPCVTDDIPCALDEEVFDIRAGDAGICDTAGER